MMPIAWLNRHAGLEGNKRTEEPPLVKTKQCKGPQPLFKSELIIQNNKVAPPSPGSSPGTL